MRLLQLVCSLAVLGLGYCTFCGDEFIINYMDGWPSGVDCYTTCDADTNTWAASAVYKRVPELESFGQMVLIAYYGNQMYCELVPSETDEELTATFCDDGYASFKPPVEWPTSPPSYTTALPTIVPPYTGEPTPYTGVPSTALPTIVPPYTGEPTPYTGVPSTALPTIVPPYTGEPTPFTGEPSTALPTIVPPYTGEPSTKIPTEEPQYTDLPAPTTEEPVVPQDDTTKEPAAPCVEYDEDGNIIVPIKEACPEGWFLFDGICYHVSSEKGTFDQGEKYCQDNGGTFAKIDSEDEWSFAMSHLTDSAWIGLNDQSQEGDFKWKSDGSSPVYTNWNQGEPNNVGNEDCVVMAVGAGYRYNDAKCSKSFQYLCQTEATAVTPDVRVTCPEGFEEFQSSCYKVSEDSGTWDDGKNYCKENGGDFVKISSDEEWSFVVSRLTGDTWLGLNDIEQENSFVWESDNSDATFFKWNAGEPNNVGDEDCVIFASRKGYLWNDAKCSKTFMFACETDMVLKEQTYQATCPIGWELFDDSCYRIDTAERSWQSGRDYCLGLGGDYASIHSSEVNSYIKSHSKNGDIWIGLNDQSVEGTFVWSNGNPVDFVTWSKNEPNNFWGNEHCVHIREDDENWNDEGCGDKMGVACERAPEMIPVD